MQLPSLICCSLAVAVVATSGLTPNQSSKQRTIRSSITDTSLASRSSPETAQQTGFVPLSSSNGFVGTSLVPQPPSNTSFLLDLPFPSHFLASLQMLNLTLPFIDPAIVISVPDDPPTPPFDVEDVINKGQFQRHENDHKNNFPNGNIPEKISTGGKRRAVNRIRYRMPVRRLPKRSEESVVFSTSKPAPYRSWSASLAATGQRRYELYTKIRSTTTTRPKVIKKFHPKLINRRANATKQGTEVMTTDSPIDHTESTTLLPTSLTQEASEDGSLTTESSDGVQATVSESSNLFVFRAPSNLEPLKPRIGGFLPIRPSPAIDEISSPDQFQPTVSPTEQTIPVEKGLSRGRDHSERFVPALPAHVLTTTESSSQFDFKPSTPIITSTSNPLQYHPKYIAQFETTTSKETIDVETGFQPMVNNNSEETTQIQKPEINRGLESNRNLAAPVTDHPIESFPASTVATDFVPNFNYPQFELSSTEGSKTLPPPLSIEELVKKYTGRDLISDVNFTSIAPSQDSSESQASSIQIVSNASSTLTSSLSRSSEDLEAGLKQLLTVTSPTSSVPNLSDSSLSISTEVDYQTSTTPPQPHIVSSTPSSFSPVLPAPNLHPATEQTIFSRQEVTTSPSLTTTESTYISSGSEQVPDRSESSSETNTTTTADSSDESNGSEKSLASVQRGPLDVSSLDNSFSSGLNQPGGFNFQSSFAPQQGQQQQFPVVQFGGFPNNNFGGNGGGGGGDGGLQNPYYYGAGLFGNSGGPGQFNQNGFDGTLHYSPTGPPAGDFNAITQGLSLLASFGGPGGGQYAIQQPAGFQQQPSGFQQPSSFQQPSGFAQSFGDFNPASLQGSPSVQSPAGFSSQSFPSFNQGFPSFNLIQQQPQSFPAQQPYQLAQFQNFPPHQPQQQQQQQFYSPIQQQQQQQYQLVASHQPPGYPVQLVQFQPQQGSVSGQQGHTQSQTAINPSQFGTLLSGFQQSNFPSFDSGSPIGTGSISQVASNSDGSTKTNEVDSSNSASSSSDSKDAASSSNNEKSIEGAASELVERKLKPNDHSIFADTDNELSQPLQLITIGPDNEQGDGESLKAGYRKSLYNRGLRSGYYP